MYTAQNISLSRPPENNWKVLSADITLFIQMKQLRAKKAEFA
jgi:hypothetical protein